jgi:hypothetical protein
VPADPIEHAPSRATVRAFVATAEFPFEPEFASLRATYVDIDAMLARPASDLQRIVPKVSGWSVEQQLAHVALANELVARNLQSLARGSGPLVVATGEPPAEALAVLVAGRFPRGRAKAPRMVQPPAEVERAYLLDWIAGNKKDFGDVESKLAELRAATLKIPHQILGPLTASQWLRFAAAHTRHHVAIAGEILAT